MNKKIKITHKYRVDLLYHVEKLAIEGFTELHKQYCDLSSPAAHLKQMMKTYRDLFMIKMGKGGAAVGFCKSMIMGIIVCNIDEYLRPTRLLDDIKQFNVQVDGDIFSEVKSLGASVLADLIQKDQFDEYLEYIINHEMFMKAKLKLESVKHFTKGDRLKNMAKRKLEEVEKEIRTALEAASEHTTTDGKLVKAFLFFVKKSDLKIPQSGITTYRELDAEDTHQFAPILHKQLENAVEEIRRTINNWDIAQKLTEKDFPSFVLDEIVGCRNRCPFCEAPCDAHSAGKTQGRHSATMHRPLGLIGVYDLKTNKLLTSDCCYNVASNYTFTHGEDNRTTPYLHYQRVYPDWKIEKKVNPRVEKIWKWVLAKYNADFAKHYNAEKADVPDEWKNFQMDDIRRDLCDSYSTPGVFDAVRNFLGSPFRPKVVTGRKQPTETSLEFKF